MRNTIKIAYHIPTKSFIHIDTADNGLACNCECLECKEKLEAIQGKIRIKHFRHHKNLHCKGSQETALHQLGKQILISNSQITIPDIGQISYSNAIAEKQFQGIRPDVSAMIDGSNIFFEIFVTHAIDNEKEIFYVKGMHKSVEIDLSEHLTSKYTEIEKAILTEVKNKRLIFWEEKPVLEKIKEPEIKKKVEEIKKEKNIDKQDVEKQDNNSDDKIIIGIIIAAIAFFGGRSLYRYLSNRKKLI